MMKIGRRALLLAALPGTAAALASAGLQFPRDHGSHPDEAIEWWYLTGLIGADALRPDYGFQLTFFRLRGPVRGEHPSPFAAHQLLLAHAALSDIKGQRLRHDQRLARVGFEHVRAAEGDSDLRLSDWTLKRTAQGYVAAFASSTAGFALELSLQATQAPLQQGEHGLSRKSAETFSHYYSQVQLQTRARLQIDGRPLQLQGRSWLDHEWSGQLLPPEAEGWDWLGINLDDGGALTAFRLRRKDGSTLWTGGSWRKPDGSLRTFSNGELVFEPQRRWRSELSSAQYPVQWRIKSPLGELQLAALFDAQEVDARRSTGMAYWEGAARLSDSRSQQIGLGYLEMTGYAGKMQI